MKVRKQKKLVKNVSLLAAVTAAVCLTCGFAGADEHASGEAGTLRSATYYSDDWVVNFWNSESANREEELAQIAQDGFNNIILCIPWREFQPQLAPYGYSGYSWEKLDRVMEAAAAQGLSVMLRVGYTWDYGGSESVLNRYSRLFYEDQERSAWLAYVEKLYQRASAHENFCGGFLTWEDFWNFVDWVTAMRKTQENQNLAEKTGYRDFVMERYELEEVCRLYVDEAEDWDELYFPTKELPAMKVFYEFYDEFLNQLLADSQQVFPGLSMEVRLDLDPVYSLDETMYGFSHQSTFSCGQSPFTSAMYSVSMGQEGKHQLTAKDALSQLPGQLERLRRLNGGKPVYLDQFLFTDNTPGFEQNPRLLDSEKAEFLEKAAPVLREHAMGYGIWTYRDYCNNKLFNSQFALGTEGWRAYGVRVEEETDGKKNRRAVLSSGATLSQDIGNHQAGIAGDGVRASFLAQSSGVSDVTVTLGNVSKAITVSGTQKVELDFGEAALDCLTIKNKGADLYVDNVQVYTWITKGEIYQFNGEPDECLTAVRQLNAALDQR